MIKNLMKILKKNMDKMNIKTNNMILEILLFSLLTIFFPILSAFLTVVYINIVDVKKNVLYFFIFLIAIDLALMAYVLDPNGYDIGDIVRIYSRYRSFNLKEVTDLFNKKDYFFSFLYYLVIFALKYINFDEKLFLAINIFCTYLILFLGLIDLTSIIKCEKKSITFSILFVLIVFNPLIIFISFRNFTSIVLLFYGIVKRIENKKFISFIFFLGSIGYHFSSIIIVIIFLLSKRKIKIPRLCLLLISFFLPPILIFINKNINIGVLGWYITAKINSYVIGNSNTYNLRILFFSIPVIIRFIIMNLIIKENIFNFYNYKRYKNFLFNYTYIMFIFVPYKTLFLRFTSLGFIFFIPSLMKIIDERKLFKRYTLEAKKLIASFIMIDINYLRFWNKASIGNGFPFNILMTLSEIINYKITNYTL